METGHDDSVPLVRASPLGSSPLMAPSALGHVLSAGARDVYRTAAQGRGRPRPRVATKD
jgi:hypothetical protein